MFVIHGRIELITKSQNNFFFFLPESQTVIIYYNMVLQLKVLKLLEIVNIPYWVATG